ncbi:MAG TPA: laccase domain-containing protein [Longimicrobiales bacterium]|nr:laccase domain-containing protein [Longimicrobiales bacterium]
MLHERFRAAPVVRERLDGSVPALVHEAWARDFPWIVQGTTIARGPGLPEGDAFDLGLFTGASPEHEVRARWTRLLGATGMRRAVHARQVHGADVRLHEPADAGEPGGLSLLEACDGHATEAPGVLLAVTVADCVPVFVVDAARRAVALLHAGWRGTAAGVLERGLALLGARAAAGSRAGAGAAELHVHLGPAICGACYEVGPEVFAVLGLPVPEAPRPLDLRAVLAARALAAGVEPGRITVSGHCTRCTGSGLFSHRSGDRGRQVAYLGIRP